MEMPLVAASHLVVELVGDVRLFSEPTHVAWVAQLLVTIAGNRKIGRAISAEGLPKLAVPLDSGILRQWKAPHQTPGFRLRH
jgi:hypothetical protein